MNRAVIVAFLVALTISAHFHAQALTSRGPLEFDIASIKRNTSGPMSGTGARTLDGGEMAMLINAQLADVVAQARPEGIIRANIVGIPDWMKIEYYDVTAKAPRGASPQQMREMWQTLFAERMKLVSHVEERETRVFNLVLGDGSPGPELKKSVFDCASQSASIPPSGQPDDPTAHCGMKVNATSVVAGGIPLDVFARVQIGPRVEGPVRNRTGLEGFYAFTLTFAPDYVVNADGLSDDPDFFTALDEQLGLRLQSDEEMVPYWVIDHVERPTPD